MKFEAALKEGEGFTLMQINVSAGAKNSGISGYNEWRKAIELRVRNPAREGKANKEVVKEMEELFGAKVEIIKGAKSNLKTLKIQMPYEKTVEILSKILSNQK